MPKARWRGSSRISQWSWVHANAPKPLAAAATNPGAQARGHQRVYIRMQVAHSMPSTARAASQRSNRQVATKSCNCAPFCRIASGHLIISCGFVTQHEGAHTASDTGRAHAVGWALNEYTCTRAPGSASLPLLLAAATCNKAHGTAVAILAGCSHTMPNTRLTAMPVAHSVCSQQPGTRASTRRLLPDKRPGRELTREQCSRAAIRSLRTGPRPIITCSPNFGRCDN